MSDRLIEQAKEMADALDSGKADPFEAASIMKALVRRIESSSAHASDCAKMSKYAGVPSPADFMPCTCGHAKDEHRPAQSHHGRGCTCERFKRMKPLDALHAKWHRDNGIPCSGDPNDPYCREASLWVSGALETGRAWRHDGEEERKREQLTEFEDSRDV